MNKETLLESLKRDSFNGQITIGDFIDRVHKYAELHASEVLSIANVRLSCFQEVWQKWCESKSTQEFDEWLHAQMHES